MKIHFGWNNLLFFLIGYIILCLFVVSILRLFNNKDAENDELAYYNEELKLANKKIEQLTLANERQRMARDLHDTLAQRIVGLILKLEASEIHLQKGNVQKVGEILASAQQQAKQSLHDARKVIDDLRIAQSTASFQEQLVDELKQLQYTFNMPIDCTLEEVPLTAEQQSHILSIIKEAITNSYKHAVATKILVSLTESEHHIELLVADNGRGIELQKDLMKQGHYGILGMNERANLMAAKLDIINDNGTIIRVTMARGEQ